MIGDSPTIVLDANGRYLDGNPAALELLGVTRERLLTMTGADLAVEPSDAAAETAFRSAWERGGRTPIYGVTTLRRPDGIEFRIRFVIEPQANERFLATLQAIDEPTRAATRVYTLGDVLEEWRAAERRLATVPPDSEEWRATQADVEALRARYQRGFEARRRDAPA